MKYFDLHCDTAVLCYENNKNFRNNGFHIDLNSIDFLDTYIQCTAIFVHDNIKNPFSYYKDVYTKLENICKTKTDLSSSFQHLFIATVENARVLEGNLENISTLKEQNIKMITLTWNADNELGSGVLGSNSGLSEFGKKAVTEFERQNIICDLSHSSEKMFWDMCEYTSKPFVASHSNAYDICKHKRNLKLWQIKELIERNSLIGINFYKAFLNENEDSACINDIIRHCEYFLSLGCENILAMGSDFDGAELPNDIKGIQSIADIYEAFLKHGYSETLVNKIFFQNAYDFFLKNIE